MSIPLGNMSRSSMRQSKLSPKNNTSSAKLTYCSLLYSSRYLFAAFSIWLSWGLFVVMEPILAQHLVSLGIGTIERGFVFAVFPAFYTVNCFTMHATTPAFLEKKTRIIFAWLIISIGFFCIGPSLLMNFPNKLWIMILG